MKTQQSTDKLAIIAHQKVKEREYWTRQLAGEPEKAAFPYDSYTQSPADDSRQEDSKKHTGVVKVELQPRLSQQVVKISGGNDYTLQVILAAGVAALLYKYTGHQDIMIGTPIYKQAVEGEYVNTVLPLRIRLEGNGTFKDLLMQVRQVVTGAVEHQSYPLELLITRLMRKGKEPGQEQEETGIVKTAVLLRNIQEEKDIAPAQPSVTFSFWRNGTHLEVETHYHLRLYNETGIRAILQHLEQLYTNWFKDINAALAGVEILPAREKQNLLEALNFTGTGYPRDKNLYELFQQQAGKNPDRVALEGPKAETKKRRSEEEKKAAESPGENTNYKLQITHKSQNTKNQQSGALGASVDAFGGSTAFDEAPVRPVQPVRHVQLTYNELNEQSDAMAYNLRQKRVEGDTITAIMVERTLEMVIGILAILKAGGAYMPIDPEYPEDRIEYMLKDSGAGVLLTDRDDVGTGHRPVPVLDIIHVIHDESGLRTGPGPVSKNPLIGSPRRGPTGHRPSATSLAYVIYTSGTTGRPKGVMITRENVVRLFFNDRFQFDFSAEDVWTLFHSYCFDFSVWEMYGAILNGGRLVIIPRMGARDLREYREILAKKQVTVLNQTPTAFYHLKDIEMERPGKELNPRYVIFGGEALQPGRLKEWKTRYPGTKLVNMYGITETTVHVTYKEIKAAEIEAGISNIGKPIPTLSVYVMDRNLQLLPVGVPGELCVGGAGVGRGYLNRPELTAEKFIMPGSPDKNNRSYRSYMSYTIYKTLYKSGDLARLTPEGDLEYLGRIDHQVKIRGYRIELGEIENRLAEHEKIKEAVVIAADGEANDKYLCAYLVPHDTHQEIPVPALREYLLKTLPEYMVPAYFLYLEHIPLTGNGKVDRKALPGPETQAGGRYEAPRDEVEIRLVDIWSRELGVEKEKIGIDANFFELGGHSLRATRVIAGIHKEFGVDIPMAALFETPFVRNLAEQIKGMAMQKYSAIEPVEKKEYYIISSAQKRLYILQQIDEQGVTYNIPSTSVLAGEPRAEILEKAFKQLINRHESLRTSFRVVKEMPVQVIHEEVEFAVEYHDASPDAGKGETLMKEFTRPFDLAKAPLIRAGLVKIAEGKYVLAVEMHHIISDGVSGQILLRDFSALYRGEGLARIRLQYKDYAEWQNRREKDENLMKQKEYWRNEFQGELPVLNLPADYPRPAVQSFEGRTFIFEINRETATGLKTLAGDTGTTLYMVLLSIYTLLLSKLGNQEDIVVGTPVAGRKHADLEEIIGMFVNTLALRNFPTGAKKFSRYLQEVKEKALNAFENQDYQYEDLVEQVAVGRDVGRNPLFDTVFILQNMETQSFEIPGLTLSPYEYRNRTSKFDWTLTAMEAGDKLLFTLEYCTKIFAHAAIERYSGYFKTLISEVLARPKEDPRLAEIEIMTGEEKQRILRDFNEAGARYTGDKTIHRLYEEQVEKNPDHVALIGPKAEAKKRRSEEEEKAAGSPGEITNYKIQNTNKLQNTNNQPGGAPRENSKLQITNNQQNGALWASEDAFGGEMALDGAPARPVQPVQLDRPVRPARPVQLTYRELNERSEAMANYLRQEGVGVETITGIRVERSLEMIIGILAILKAGGAYLPIDPEYPRDRIEYMLKDSGTKILVTANNIETLIDGTYRSHRSYTSYKKPAAGHRPPATSLAYVIYTSGSTGKPKGVLTTHANVTRVVKNTNYIDIGPGDRVLQLSDYAFDGSVFDIYGALLNGAGLVLITKEEIFEISRFLAVIKREGNTVFFVTTALFNTLVEVGIDSFQRVRKVLFGGERVSVEHAQKALDNLGKGRIIHVYGPTETTVYATYYFIEAIDAAAGNIPIGKPLSGTTLYILEKQMKPVPIGVSGELYIGGTGVARGYLNNPGLTAEKFIMPSATKNPFEKGFPDFPKLLSDHRSPLPLPIRYLPEGRLHLTRNTKHLTLYKTGDLVRWLPDGNIEFQGRIDQQVKIRGFRIELGEIESRLMKHEDIKEAVVLAGKHENGDSYLSAYITVVREIPLPGIKEYLREHLPGYMIPADYVLLEKIPLTPGGKLDRQKLKSMGKKIRTGVEQVAPQSADELIIAQAWKDVLKLEEVGIYDNFFDMGGTSLDIIRLNSKLTSVLKREIPIIAMYRYTTIDSFSRFLAAGSGETGNNPAGTRSKAREDKIKKGMEDKNKRREIRTRRNK